LPPSSTFVYVAVVTELATNGQAVQPAPQLEGVAPLWLLFSGHRR
jgi:hypothetical protein